MFKKIMKSRAGQNTVEIVIGTAVIAALAVFAFNKIKAGTENKTTEIVQALK